MLVATAFTGVAAFAQNGGGRSEMVKHYLTDSLNVSAVNADSVVAITQRSMMEMRNIRQDQALSQDEKREKMQPLMEVMRTEMKKYLTEEQATKLQERLMQRRQERGGNNKK